jgi:hypothetical protein
VGKMGSFCNGMARWVRFAVGWRYGFVRVRRQPRRYREGIRCCDARGGHWSVMGCPPGVVPDGSFVLFSV